MNGYLESEKKEVRSKFLSMRKHLGLDLILTYSAAVFAKIKKLSVYKQAHSIMTYLSCGSEVITDFIVQSALEEGKDVAVPAVENSSRMCMQAVKITSLKDADELVYGIRQPKINSNNTVSKDSIDLIFVPGLAFDLSGYRLGYGRGYYDRWLKGVPLFKTAGLAFDFQIAGKLPREKHDLPVGIIVTEQRIIQTIN